MRGWPTIAAAPATDDAEQVIDNHRALGPSAWAACAAALVFALSVPAPCDAGQISVSSEVQARPIRVTRRTHGRRGRTCAAGHRSTTTAPSGRRVDFRGDVVVYGANGRDAFVDGEAMLVWRGTERRGSRRAAARAVGPVHQLRARRPRSGEHALFARRAGAAPEPADHQSDGLLRRLSVDMYALAGRRRQPLPDSEGRFGFGVPRVTSPHAAAWAIRRSRCASRAPSRRRLGRTCLRRPQPPADIRAALQPERGTGGVDAIYTEMLQVGGELETTRADWRLMAEGFSAAARST